MLPLQIDPNKNVFVFLFTISIIWHVFLSLLPNGFLKVWLSGPSIEMDFVCFYYLVIWDDDSNDNDENRRKRWHCVIRWLSNRKCVWTTTEIFVKNLQSFLSISVIWHAMLSFMGIQNQLPEKYEIWLFQCWRTSNTIIFYLFITFIKRSMVLEL